MACTGLIDADILYDCDEGSVGGLEVDVVLINRSEIDITALAYDATNKLKLTNLALKTAKTGYLLKSVKQVHSTSYELVPKDTGVDKVSHVFNGLILTPSADNKLQLQNMKEGADLVAVVEKKWKGTDDEEAFEVLGIESGLILTAVSYTSTENDGAITFTLSSQEGYEEPKLPLTLLETDYATTKTAFGNKFASA